MDQTKLYFLNDGQQGDPAPTPRERQLEAAVWGVLFLVAEIGHGIRNLRNTLVFKGVLTPEDDERLTQITMLAENARKAYETTEVAFRQRYANCRFSLENPEQLREIMRQDELRRHAEEMESTKAHVGSTAAPTGSTDPASAE